MHPTPDQRNSGDTGRIISLGEVRRRRAGRNRAPDRQYLAVAALVAGLSWAVWATVILTIAPERLLTYLAFFLPLWTALTASGSLVAYGVSWRRGYLPSLRACVRRGALVASYVVANLALVAAHRWTVIFGLATLAFAVGWDVLLTRRSW